MYSDPNLNVSLDLILFSIWLYHFKMFISATLYVVVTILLRTVYLPMKLGSFHLVLISRFTCRNLMYTVVMCKKAAILMSWLKTDLSGAKTPVSLIYGKNAGRWPKPTDIL